MKTNTLEEPIETAKRIADEMEEKRLNRRFYHKLKNLFIGGSIIALTIYGMATGVNTYNRNKFNKNVNSFVSESLCLCNLTYNNSLMKNKFGLDSNQVYVDVVAGAACSNIPTNLPNTNYTIYTPDNRWVDPKLTAYAKPWCNNFNKYSLNRDKNYGQSVSYFLDIKTKYDGIPLIFNISQKIKVDKNGELYTQIREKCTSEITPMKSRNCNSDEFKFGKKTLEKLIE